MIQITNDLPDYVAGFTATDTITKEDYTSVVIPRIEEVVEKHGHIHFFFQLNTDVKNFTGGAWLEDLLIGLKKFTKWKKMAIVSDQDAVVKITNALSILMPGESRGFNHDQVEEAKMWVASEG